MLLDPHPLLTPSADPLCEVGTFFNTFPRSRNLISINRRNLAPSVSEEFALRHDWHSLLETGHKLFNQSARWFPHADSLVHYLREVAADVNVRYNVSVTSTKVQPSGRHLVHTQSGVSYLAEHLVLATGYRMATPPSCLVKSTYDMHTYADFPPLDPSTLDADWCRGKKVVIFGSGNAAFETADMLATCAAETILFFKNTPRFSALTHYVGDVRLHSAGILDRFQLKSLDSLFPPANAANIERTLTEPQGALAKLEAQADPSLSLLKTALKTNPSMIMDKLDACRIVTKGQESPDGKSGKTFLGDDGVILFAGGFTTDRAHLVKTNSSRGASKAARRFPRVSSWWEDPSQPRKWYAGALMHGTDYGVSAGGFIHGFRYLVRAQVCPSRSAAIHLPTTSPLCRVFVCVSVAHASLVCVFDSSAQFRNVMATYFETPWPRFEFSTFKAAAAHALSRVQNSSGLYQMQEMLVDVLEVHEDGSVTYYEELPDDWWHDALGQPSCVITLQFLYSNKEAWTWDLLYSFDHVEQNPGLFLHPVVTAYLDGQQIGEVPTLLTTDSHSCLVASD